MVPFLRKVFPSKRPFSDSEPPHDNRSGDDDKTGQYEQDERQRDWDNQQQQREEEKKKREVDFVPVAEENDSGEGFDQDKENFSNDSPISSSFETINSIEVEEIAAAAGRSITAGLPATRNATHTHIHNKSTGTQCAVIVEGPSYSNYPHTPYGRKLAIEAWKQKQEKYALRGNGIGVLTRFPEHLNMGRERFMEFTGAGKALLFAKTCAAKVARLGSGGKALRQQLRDINQQSDDEDEDECPSLCRNDEDTLIVKARSLDDRSDTCICSRPRGGVMMCHKL